MRSLNRKMISALQQIGPRFLPFADAATKDLPLSRLLRLSLFQVSVGMALVLLTGTLNRVMIVELDVPAWLVGIEDRPTDIDLHQCLIRIKHFELRPDGSRIRIHSGKPGTGIIPVTDRCSRHVPENQNDLLFPRDPRDRGTKGLKVGPFGRHIGPACPEQFALGVIFADLYQATARR